MFGLSLELILINNAYELIVGTLRMLVTQSAVVLTTVIAVIAALQLAYSWAMKRRAVLK